MSATPLAPATVFGFATTADDAPAAVGVALVVFCVLVFIPGLSLPLSVWPER